MTTLVAAYVLSVGIGWTMRKLRHHGGRETAAYLIITTLGAVLWASILLRRPLDFNDLIAFVIDWIRP